MYLKEYLKKFDNKKLKIFVDMDGVIADYEVGMPCDFDKKRPLYSSISKLEEISKMANVELYILSITRMDEGYEEKNIWLDKYAPFFKKENRVIISRESNNFVPSPELKSNFLKELKRDGSIFMVIDDDPIVLHKIQNTSKDIVLLKDTALVD
ncbi:MAG: hypothetical protein IKF17_04620 [Clostridia bacterium]|nr:hypothetical protein [Clostridia bacterium]